MKGPVIVLLTNTGIEGGLMTRQLVNHGLPPTLVVKESNTSKIRYRAHSRFARSLLGDEIVNRLAHWRLPREKRAALEWEHESHGKAQAWLLEQAEVIGLAQPVQEGASITTASINSEDVVTRIHAIRPDVMLVLGTGILRSPIIAAPTKGIINIHSSLLPYYRGTFAEFWQCLLDDPAHVGVTFHLVNEGIDSGDILQQAPVEAQWPVEPHRLRAMNMLKAISLAPHVIRDFLDGHLVPYAQGPTDSPMRYARDLTVDRRVELWRRLVHA